MSIIVRLVLGLFFLSCTSASVVFAEQASFVSLDSETAVAMHELDAIRIEQMQNGALANFYTGDYSVRELKRLRHSVSPYGTLDMLSVLDGIVWQGPGPSNEQEAIVLVQAFVAEYAGLIGV